MLRQAPERRSPIECSLELGCHCGMYLRPRLLSGLHSRSRGRIRQLAGCKSGKASTLRGSSAESVGYEVLPRFSTARSLSPRLTCLHSRLAAERTQACTRLLIGVRRIALSDKEDPRPKRYGN